jgi:hypothetical protein
MKFKFVERMAPSSIDSGWNWSGRDELCRLFTGQICAVRPSCSHSELVQDTLRGASDVAAPFEDL